uniref:Uncharacterized protein n=1 Tax=viral metagenome TaxID=1070528 RepID=A0A2V0RC50_9ZZZZ
MSDGYDSVANRISDLNGRIRLVLEMAGRKSMEDISPSLDELMKQRNMSEEDKKEYLEEQEVVKKQIEDSKNRLKDLERQVTKERLFIGSKGYILEDKPFEKQAARAYLNLKQEVNDIKGEQNMVDDMVDFPTPLETLRRALNEANKVYDDIKTKVKGIEEKRADLKSKIEDGTREFERLIMVRQIGMELTAVEATELTNAIEEVRQTMAAYMEGYDHLANQLKTQKDKLRNKSYELKETKDKIIKLETSSGLSWRDDWVRNWDDAFLFEGVQPELLMLLNLCHHYYKKEEDKRQVKALERDEMEDFMAKISTLRVHTLKTIGDDVVMNLKSIQSRERHAVNALSIGLRLTAEELKQGKVIGPTATAEYIGELYQRNRWDETKKGAYAKTNLWDGKSQYHMDADAYLNAVNGALSKNLHMIFLDGSDPRDVRSRSNVLGSDPAGRLNLIDQDVDILILLNKISRSGLDPRRWLRACEVTIGGMVNRILLTWEQNDRRALTADELRGAFDPRFQTVMASIEYVESDHSRMRPNRPRDGKSGAYTSEGDTDSDDEPDDGHKE